VSSALPFTVIGGYLGAGKTTLLNQLLANAQGLRIAALVNDFGSVNIDVELVRSHNGETIDLKNGCMCCSLVNGFASAIGALRARAADFDHVVIEASGVADPAKVAQYGQMYELPLDGIVVVVDAEQIETQSANKYVGDTVLRQLEQADLILLNKVDLVSTEKRAGLSAWLAERAPGAPLIETTGAQVPWEVVLGAHGERPPLCADTSEPTFARWLDHARRYQSWTLEPAAALSPAQLSRFALALGKDVYRAKGIVSLAGDPEHRYVYQQVGARWSLEQGVPWGEEPARTRLVVIGRRGTAQVDLLDEPAETTST
jgi:G3E family GTPase